MTRDHPIHNGEPEHTPTPATERLASIVAHNTGGPQPAWAARSSITQIATRTGLSVADVDEALAALVREGTLAVRETEDGERYALASEVEVDE